MTDSEILRIVATNVKMARRQAGLTQECVAELTGVHWQTISYLESARHPIPITTFARLCQALEVSPDQLLTGLPEPDKAKMDKIRKALARKRRSPETQNEANTGPSGENNNTT